jgi:hypothetical protein
MWFTGACSAAQIRHCLNILGFRAYNVVMRHILIPVLEVQWILVWHVMVGQKVRDVWQSVLIVHLFCH